MKVGDKVEHEGFGNGVVIFASSEHIIVDFAKFEVTFDNESQSTLRVI